MGDQSADPARAVIVAGVSGSGKTTVGELLADRLGWRFTDGDSLHPAANIAKMARGQPLTDADRWPWLRRIGEVIDAALADGGSPVIACSALKRGYRAELLGGRPAARMAFLLIGFEAACGRLAARRNHFFDPDLLASQFAVLEPPVPDEDRVLPVQVAGPPEALAGQIIGRLGLASVR